MRATRMSHAAPGQARLKSQDRTFMAPSGRMIDRGSIKMSHKSTKNIVS